MTLRIVIELFFLSGSVCFLTGTLLSFLHAIGRI